MNSYAVCFRISGTAPDASVALQALGARKAEASATWWLTTQDPDDAALAALLAPRHPGLLAAVGAAHGVDDTSARFARDLATGALIALEKSQVRYAVAVGGESPEAAADAESALRLVARIIGDRSEAEWRVVDLLTPGVRGQYKTVASALGITTQAVSKALSRTGWHEELLGRTLAARLLREAAGGAI